MALRVLTPGDEQQMYELLENRQTARVISSLAMHKPRLLLDCEICGGGEYQHKRTREDTRDIDAADRSMRVVGRAVVYGSLIFRTFVPSFPPEK